MERQNIIGRGWCVLALATVLFAGAGKAQENIGTVRQPLVGGSVIDGARQEEFGLLSYSDDSGVCSASLLRNGWVITAAHCVEGKDVATMTLTAGWGAGQTEKAVRVETFPPYDVALIQVARPFKVRGLTTGYARLIFQDGQFPYFGEPVGANLLVFGQGINVFASGEGDSAIPSSSDGQYRMSYAKATRNEDNRYWYPGYNGQMIAGGDSGGPSFAWVLSGYALVGVHSIAKTTRVPGKTKDPNNVWEWVTSTPEAADAPIAPVWDQIFRIMGPAPPAPPEASVDSPPPGFIGTFAATPPNYQPLWIYGIRPNGDLMWYRKDSNATAWQGPKRVGTGWHSFKDVIPAGGNRLYALTKEGKLLWYQHDGFNDGSFIWKQPVEVGSGWTFSRIFSGGQGIVYAIRNDGVLLWYKNNGADYGIRSWQEAKAVGTGWGGFKDVFSTGEGAIYAVRTDGTLVLYQHDGYLTGEVGWRSVRVVGTGWDSFQQIIPSSDGVILAIRPNGQLLWYKHRGLVAPGGPVAPEPGKALGRVRVGVPTNTPPRPICDVARDARARNSPAAPGLEAQCRAAGAAGASPAVDVNALATKGEALANEDPLATELRNQQPDEQARRGFDIGMAAAEGHTAPGPGKDRTRDSLPLAQRGGFTAAVTFSLERNRNANQSAAQLRQSSPIRLLKETWEGPVIIGNGWQDFGKVIALIPDPLASNVVR